MYQRKRIRNLWSEAEDELLQEAVASYGKKWTAVAQYMNTNRNPSQCCQRWKKLSNIKAQSRWTPQEDQIVLNHDLEDSLLMDLLPNRTMKQIRERFINVLDPRINRQSFTKEEDETIWKFTQVFGRKWTELSTLLPGRPENMIKNRFYQYIREEYGDEQKPYLISYKNGKASYMKKILKRQRKTKVQMLLCSQASTEGSEEYFTPTYLDSVEDEQFEESQQYSFQRLL